MHLYFIMSGLCCHFILVATCCALNPSLKRNEIRYIYQPYGPKLCREKCSQSGYTYYFLKNDLSCRHHSPENFFSGDNSCRMKDASTLAGMSGVNVCYMDTQDAKWNLHLNFKEAMTLTVKGDTVPYNHNISLDKACEEGNLCLVKFIIFQNLTDINQPGRMGRTPVMAAASTGQIEVFDFLVTQGCDLTAVDENKNTVLHDACSGGNIDIIRWLVDSKYVVNSRTRYGQTPIMMASFYGHVTVVNLLVNNSCSIEEVDQYGFNILHMACKGGHVDMVRYILEKLQYNIESKTYFRRTPLLVATQSGHIEVVKYLVQKGCNLTAVDKESSNIIHIASYLGDLDIVRYTLEEIEFDIEIKGFRERISVMMAKNLGHIKLVQHLLQRRCDWREVNQVGDNILHLACYSGSVTMVRYILEKLKLNVDSKGCHGGTPVLLAAFTGLTEVVKYLVQEGCNLTAVDGDKRNILHVACTSGNVDLVRYIIEDLKFTPEEKTRHGDTPIMLAASSGHIEVVKYLVEKRGNVEVVNIKGHNLLHMACTGGNIDMVRYIIKELNFRIEIKDYQSRTPVMIAAGSGKIEVVKYLVQKGCNIAAVDKSGSSILAMACMNGNLDLVKYVLEEHKFDVDNRDGYGRTPVMIAAYYGWLNVVKYLVHWKCNLTAVDARGTSILQWANSGKHKDVIYFLKTVTKRGSSLQR